MSALAFALALAAALYVSAQVTDGFQAFTLESARRHAALRTPRNVAPLQFITLGGEQSDLARYQGSWVLVDFIYTRCETLCTSLGAVYAQLQRRLSREIANGQVRLLSVSFDPIHDGAEQLLAFRTRHGGSALGWDMARPSSVELSRWLKDFGVVVIPDEFGGFAHNAAIHVVGPDARLRAIFDLDDVDEVVRHVQAAS